MNVVHVVTIPLFTALICIELFLTYKEDREKIDLPDIMINLKIGALAIFVNAMLKAIYMGFFLYLFEYRIFNFDLTIGSGLLLFLLCDLLFYLFHLLGHKSRFFWAMHVVHHSSEKYNFTTALRIPFANAIFRYGILMIPVILGYHPAHVLLMDSIIVSITFLHHTEKVRKLGWLEYILNTPSHHRVHHATNDEYIDKNLGGVLIVWDKIFGTFEPERETPVYGLTKPVRLHSVNRVMTHELSALWRDLGNHDFFTRLCILFASPSWRPGSRKVFRTRWILRYPFLLIFLAVLHISGYRAFSQLAELSRNEVQGKDALTRTKSAANSVSLKRPDKRLIRRQSGIFVY